MILLDAFFTAITSQEMTVRAANFFSCQPISSLVELAVCPREQVAHWNFKGEDGSTHHMDKQTLREIEDILTRNGLRFGMKVSQAMRKAVDEKAAALRKELAELQERQRLRNEDHYRAMSAKDLKKEQDAIETFFEKLGITKSDKTSSKRELALPELQYEVERLRERESTKSVR